MKLGLATALKANTERAKKQRACLSLIEAYEIYTEIGAEHKEAVRAVAGFPLLPVQGLYGMADLYQRAALSVEKDTPEYIDLRIGIAHWARNETNDDEMAKQVATEALDLSIQAD